MNKKKRMLLATLLLAALLVVLIPLTIWLNSVYVFVGFRMYPRDAKFLNLHDTGITIRQYESLRKKLPDCRLYWEVPFQGNYYPENTKEIRFTGLTEEDVKALTYFPKLQVMDARGCEDYEMLLKLQEQFPDCEVRYNVSIDGRAYPQDTLRVTLANLTDEEVALTDYLPKLKTVKAEGCEDYAQLAALQERHPRCTVEYSILISGQTYDVNTIKLEAEGADPAEVMAVLDHMPNLRTVDLVNPTGGLDALLELKESRPDIDVSWEIELLGVTVRSDATEADFSGIPLESVEPVKEAMEYLPDVEMVILSDCGIDNETMAAFREEKREDYKVVWTVDCGGIPVRTDETTFMPIKHHVYYFHDDDIYNLRYCEDMIAVDVGHMTFTNLEFVSFMPHLKYLILAHTTVLDITPISNCKELVFLELDWTGIRNYEPLLGCTGLEDLNLGLTYGDPEIIAQMTWLKNLWWKGRGNAAQLLQEKLPDTNMNFSSKHTVGGGWRNLQNYYDMRDLLEMPYMSG